MFERFTSDARETVVLAQREARELRHGTIGTEHLLLALLDQPWTATAQVLGRHGLTRPLVVEAVTALVGGDDLDAEALRAVGIDLDAVRDRVEATFGPGALDRRAGDRSPGRGGHIPFSPRAKKVLELSLREAIAQRSKSIREGHIALGMLREGQGLAVTVLHDRGVDLAALRRDLEATILAA
ncbi:Clp protease N-terminal domain-containing protein [Geodermatophilus sp. SYSU D00697]